MSKTARRRKPPPAVADRRDGELRHGLYLTVDRLNDGRPGFLAICSDGSPQLGHKQVTVLDLEIVPNMKAAEDWFETVKLYRPWEREKRQ